jgi:hypothetical protein
LANFLFKRHLAEKAIHAGLDLWIGELGVGWMPDLGRRSRRRQSGSLRGSLGDCMGGQSGDRQAKGRTGQEAAEAKVRPETGTELGDEFFLDASCHGRVPPGDGLWNGCIFTAGAGRRENGRGKVADK